MKASAARFEGRLSGRVTTRARLAFVVNEERKFGFFRTEVISNCPKWGDLDAVVAIGEFIEDVVAVIGFNNGQIARAQWTAPVEYHDECLVVLTEDWFTAASTDFRAYRLAAGGVLEPVEQGFEIALRMEVDVPAQTTMGQWTLQYDLSALTQLRPQTTETRSKLRNVRRRRSAVGREAKFG